MRTATFRAQRDARPASLASLHAACLVPIPRISFYREEFLKHYRCLNRQREYFSPEAIRSVECALETILTRLDVLCRHQDCDRLLGALLKKLDVVTRVSAWDDSLPTH